MQYIAESTASKAAIGGSYNAMAWIYAIGSLHSNSPTESQFTKVVLQGLERSLAKPVVKNLPVTAEKLAAMVEDMEDQDLWLISSW